MGDTFLGAMLALIMVIVLGYGCEIQTPHGTYTMELLEEDD
jgi:hypothetical protein